MSFFIAGDPAQAPVPGGATLWGPGYPTVARAQAALEHLALVQTVRLVIIEAGDFPSAVRQLQTWPAPTA